MTHRIDSETSDPIIDNNKIYDAMKFVAMVLLPAVGTLYFALAPIWGLPDADKVVGTVGAVDTFLGVVLHISNLQYKSRPLASDSHEYDGTVVVSDKPDGSGKTFFLKLNCDDADLDRLHEKSSILFRVEDQTVP